MSNMLLDSSAPRVNLLTKDSSIAMPVSMCLLIANTNLSNMVADKFGAISFSLFLSNTWGHFPQDLQQQNKPVLHSFFWQPSVFMS